MKNELMNRLQCDEVTAERLEKRLTDISDTLQPYLKEWLETGQVDNDLTINGYSVDRLMNTMGMKYTGALLTLDWLIREPELASEAIERGIM